MHIFKSFSLLLNDQTYILIVSNDIVLKGLAYPVNGIIMGGLDWKFTMLAMWIANAVCVGMLKFGGVVTLNKIWWALAAFMGVQVVSGILRFLSHTGVWSKLAAEKNRSDT